MGVDSFLFNVEDKKYIWLGRMYLTDSNKHVTPKIIDAHFSYELKTLIEEGWIFDKEVFYGRYWFARFLKDYIRNSKCPIIYKTDYDKDWDDFVKAQNYMEEFDLHNWVDKLAHLFGWFEGAEGYYA